MRRAMCVAAALSLVAAGAARGQETGKFEIGLFGRYTAFGSHTSNLGNELDYINRFGPGARLGYFITPAIGVEVDGSLADTHRTSDTSGENPVRYRPFHGLLTLNVPLAERFTLVTGLGGNITQLRPSDNADTDTDPGISLLIGGRVHLTDALALRLDGNADWVRHVGGTTDNMWNLGAQAGLSVLLGRHGAPAEPENADEDGDGVVNTVDHCPGTAPRTAVDGWGCPKRQDSDGDGVSNLDDICPGTPAMATVDANGCSAAQRSGDTTATPAAPAPSRAATPADTAAAAKVDTVYLKADTAAGDRDGDGIIDTLDRCPGTPKGAKVDASGCTGTLDGDGDGVLDDRDKCPTTKPGTPVDASGCPSTKSTPRTGKHPPGTRGGR